jgi:T5SS/PEP-CTERM-associated repeat protein
MRRGYLVAGFLVWIALGSYYSEAQYTANFQTNIISGVTSNWSGVYTIGDTNFADVLLIENSGVLSNSFAYIGRTASSTNNSVLVTGSGSVWVNTLSLTVGFEGTGNSMVISNGGQVVDAGCNLGDEGGSSNNFVLVIGPGSVWTNNGGLSIGAPGAGAGNQLLVSGGACVFSTSGLVNSPGTIGVSITGTGSIWSMTGGLVVGVANGTNTLTVSDGAQLLDASGEMGEDGGVIYGNAVLVTGSGSVWSNSGTLTIGEGGAGNSLVITNGGTVVDTVGVVGSSGITSNNTVRVLDGGSWWNTTLLVGDYGASNSVEIDGGSVSATNVIIGARLFMGAFTTCENVLELDSGGLIVTNATGTGVLDVRNGQLILNGGVLQADTLVITNPCAQFVHTAGTLIVGNVVLDPNTFRIVSVARQTNDMLVTWMMGPGATNTLQASAGDGNGGYTTNGFTNIFIVTNNTSIGTVTNHLDLGAATNTLSRYYRARLVP